jgi:hypothetical protein
MPENWENKKSLQYTKAYTITPPQGHFLEGIELHFIFNIQSNLKTIYVRNNSKNTNQFISHLNTNKASLGTENFVKVFKTKNELREFFKTTNEFLTAKNAQRIPDVYIEHAFGTFGMSLKGKFLHPSNPQDNRCLSQPASFATREGARQTFNAHDKQASL